MSSREPPTEPYQREMSTSTEDQLRLLLGNESAEGREVLMDGSVDPAATLAPQNTAPNNASSPRPGRTGTPVRHTPSSVANGDRNETGSRAASVHPEATFTIPNEAPPNGAPVRQYLNMKLTGPLLEGMKLIAKEQPKDPLRVLGEYLIQRSRELEGTK